MEATISFENVGKSYPFYHHMTGGIKNFIFHFQSHIAKLRNSRFEAIKEVSFNIGKGETFGIIGRNGAGKSTILGLMAGVLKPNIGTVKLFGRVSPLLELGAGFHPELSGRENIMLNGVLMGLTRKDVTLRMEEIIDFSELQEFIDQPIRVYSSGMLARLGFSIVAHLDPEILLIDEVLAVGDVEFQRKCLNKMADFKKNGITIVFVSHSREAVESICDRVLWLDNKMVRMIGRTGLVCSECFGKIS
jgi:lipopolysaccharide transport system ATP-binding protein